MPTSAKFQENLNVQ